MKLFILALFVSFTSYAQAFTIFEINESPGAPTFFDNEHILTWGQDNLLGEPTTVSYSFAESDYACHHGNGACFSLDTFMDPGYQNVITSAFDTWASVSNLTFNQVNNLEGDIVLGGEYIINLFNNETAHAVTRYETFDNNVYSFSYIEPSAIHFNKQMKWSIDAPELGEIDLFSIALHEIGHSLGLGHSSVEEALMYPYYSGVNTLHADDIAGIQFLYGSVSAVPEPSTSALFLLGTLMILGYHRRKFSINQTTSSMN